MIAIGPCRVPRLCLGTMYFGTKVSVEDSLALLDMSFEQGVNFFDTANKYASWLPGGVGGESERVLGQWVRDRRVRDRVTVATKIGLAMPGVEAGLRAEQVESLCEASLQRLGTDRIDVLYAHADDRQTPLEETLGAFERLRRAGKILAMGVSNFQAWRIMQAHLTGTVPLACLQVRHSYLRADPWIPQEFPVQVPATPEILDVARTLNIPVLAYSPLLSGAYAHRERMLPPSYRGVANTRRWSAAEHIALQRGLPIHQVVLAWLMAQDPVMIPVITASRRTQLAENLGAQQVILSPQELAWLDGAAVREDEEL